MDHSVVHARLLHRRIGIANIPIDLIDLHPALRRPDPAHVSALKRTISEDTSARWAQPIDVVAGSSISPAWLDVLRAARISTAVPSGDRFICIGGQHRVLASRQFVKDWIAENENQAVPTELSSWPATVYERVVLHDPQLDIWMVERNLARSSLQVTMYERLAIIDNLDDVDAQKHALSLLGWTSKDTPAILSVRNSTVWKPLLQLLQWPLFSSMASGSIVDWSIEYHAYPILALLLDDVLQQQEQLRAMKKDDEAITMDFVFGQNCAYNQQIQKSGTLEVLCKIWGTNKRPVAEEFDVKDFDEFWRQATHRTNKAFGREVDSPFLFGSMIPTLHDVNFHNVSSPFSYQLRKTEIAASVMHILLHYPNLVTFPPRRPKLANKEIDWLQVFDRGADRDNGQKLLVYLLSNVDQLFVGTESFKQALKHDQYPHMMAMANETALSRLVKATATSAWQDVIEFADELGMSLASDMAQLRGDWPQSDSGGEEEVAKSLEKGKGRAQEQVEKVSAQLSRPKRKRATKAILTVTTKAPGGTVVDQRVVRQRKKPRLSDSVAADSDDSEEEEATNVASSQTVQDYKDDDGNIYDGYRLGSSLNTAKTIKSGKAFVDPETSRLMVLREDIHEEYEGSTTRALDNFHSRLKSLPFEEAELTLDILGIEKDEVNAKWMKEMENVSGKK